MNFTNLQSRYLTFFDSDDSQAVESTMKLASEAVKTSELLVQEQTASIQAYQKYSTQLAECKMELLSLAEKISSQVLTVNEKEFASKKFIFNLYYMKPYIEDQMKQTEQKAGFKMPKLNQEIIDELIEEFSYSHQQAMMQKKVELSNDSSSSEDI